jgi:hypothetical protein
MDFTVVSLQKISSFLQNAFHSCVFTMDFPPCCRFSKSKIWTRRCISSRGEAGRRESLQNFSTHLWANSGSSRQLPANKNAEESAKRMQNGSCIASFRCEVKNYFLRNRRTLPGTICLASFFAPGLYPFPADSPGEVNNVDFLTRFLDLH